MSLAFQPPSDWVAPTEYPDLRGYDTIAIDLETRDPELTTMGSGWATGNGEVIGYAVAVDGRQWYFPVRHQNGPNLDPKITENWMREICSYERTTYVFHNALYDLGWLRASGIKIAGRVVDTMVAAPLLDENRFSYSLNNLLKDYLGERKNERELRAAAAEFGLNPKSEMYKLPAHYVGTYAEQDAAGTLKLWNHIKNQIVEQDITSIFDMETRLTPILIEMRARGVRVDVDKAEQVKREMRKKEQEILEQIHREYGIAVEVWAASSVAKVFTAAGLSFSRTEKTGAPSFTKAFLSSHTHPVAQQIVQVRELNKASSTFLDSILNHQHKGRIHADAHPLRSDEGGTVTGRFSYSNPNLQQIPARNPVIGPLIRGLFLPEEGTQWGSFDYSSQEPRLVAHYAGILDFEGAREFVQRYREDKHTDFHTLAAEIIGVDRKHAKTINLGLFYGMGKGKLADQLGLSMEEANALFDVYHAKVPFVRELSEYCAKRADSKGVIRTLLGRRCRFDKWEPRKYGIHSPKTYQEAYAEHGPHIKRAFTYKALNKLIQGSAADQTKAAMLACYEVGQMPMVQVHDELAYSVENEQQGRYIQEIMENCVQMEVPSVVDAEFGPTWGEAKTSFSDKPWSRGLAGNHSLMADNNS